MKTTLLIDINDTLDDGSDFQYREKQHLLDLETWAPTWVMWPRKWIEDFSAFLIEYKAKLLPIFWSSVWLYGQDFVAREWLKTEIIWFDGKTFHTFKTNDILHPSATGIMVPKGYYMNILMDYIRWKSEHIIWFEDWLNLEDQCFVDGNGHVDHVWVNQVDTLTEKIPEIIKLIK